MSLPLIDFIHSFVLPCSFWFPVRNRLSWTFHVLLAKLYYSVTSTHKHTHTRAHIQHTHPHTYEHTHTRTQLKAYPLLNLENEWWTHIIISFCQCAWGFLLLSPPFMFQNGIFLEIVYYFQSTKLLISFTCLQLNSIFSLLCLFFPIANFCFAGFQKLFFFHFFSIYLFFSYPFACFSGFSYISLLFLSWQKSNILDNSHFNLLLRLILTKQNLDLRSHWVWTLNKHKLHTKNNYVNSKTLFNINHCPVRNQIIKSINLRAPLTQCDAKKVITIKHLQQ